MELAITFFINMEPAITFFTIIGIFTTCYLLLSIAAIPVKSLFDKEKRNARLREEDRMHYKDGEQDASTN